MSTDGTTTTPEEPSLVSRLSATAGDLQLLLEQHGRLIYAEVQADLARFVNAILLLAGGVTLLVPGLLLLAFMCVHLIHWAIQDNPSEQPLWLGFAVVGGLLTLIGGICTGAAVMALRSFNPLPDRSIAIFWKNMGSIVADPTKA